MSDIRKRLAGKFSQKNRYANFGPCLRKILISGFRGIENLEIQFSYPITAISGLNGSGKSTIGQIAICAYKKPSTVTEYKRQYIKDFFPVSVADPKPITKDAQIVYYYETDNPQTPQRLTLTRTSSAWSGYKRQPERCCYYVGFTVYIPKVERRDLSIYQGKSIELAEKRQIDGDVQQKLARILGQHYEEIAFQEVKHKTKRVEIGRAKKFGCSYSENNMGFGEGRVLYIVDKLENAPEQSLFVIEEPETSLHENAQYELTKYFLDVCDRRHHQIILSTHSSIILSALPKEACKLLIRDKDGVKIYDELSASQVRSILSGGRSRGLDICVEDKVAKMLLTEIIRKNDPTLLKSITIHIIGDKIAVGKAVSILLKTGKPAIGIRDGDVGEDPSKKLYSFHGTEAPEKVIFSSDKVKVFFKDNYNIDMEWLRTKYNIHDHHEISKILAKELEIEESIILKEAIDKYLEDNSKKFRRLIENIKSNL